MLEGEMYNYEFRYMLFQGQITFHNFQLTYNIFVIFFLKTKINYYLLYDMYRCSQRRSKEYGSRRMERSGI